MRRGGERRVVLEDGEVMGEREEGFRDVVFDRGPGGRIRKGDDEERSGEDKQRVARAQIVATVAHDVRRYMLRYFLVEYVGEREIRWSLQPSHVYFTPQATYM